MPAIPPFLLKKLYVKGSLRVEGDGLALDLKNTIAPGTIVGFKGFKIDDRDVSLGKVEAVQPGGEARPVTEISPEEPLSFPLNQVLTLRVSGTAVEPGSHSLVISVVVQDIGPLEIQVADQLG
jgi:hydroxymethylglutaryl-CoA reductase (NADPH)